LKETRERQTSVRNQIAEQTKALNEIEERRSDALTITSEHRIIYSQKATALEQLNNRKHPMETRIRELEELINDRTGGIDAYNRRIEDLKRSIETEITKTEPLEERLQETAQNLEAERARREETIRVLSTAEHQLRGLRNTLENEHEKKSGFEVERAEFKMRYDNALERVTGTYHMYK
jgi:chromosome segregation ATPase